MISKEASLMTLSPPVFGSECTLCKLWRKLLPWQVSLNGSWAPICAECGKNILIRQLHSSLLAPFQKDELFEALLRFGVNKLEAELLIGNLMKERSILETAAGLFWSDSSKSDEVVKPLVAGAEREQKPRHVFRKKTAQEVFLQCVKLSREIRSRTDQGDR